MKRRVRISWTGAALTVLCLGMAVVLVLEEGKEPAPADLTSLASRLKYEVQGCRVVPAGTSEEVGFYLVRSGLSDHEVRMLSLNVYDSGWEGVAFLKRADSCRVTTEVPGPWMVTGGVLVWGDPDLVQEVWGVAK